MIWSHQGHVPPEWSDVVATWAFKRGIKDEVNLPDYSVFQRLMTPAIQLILDNPLCGGGGEVWRSIS